MDVDRCAKTRTDWKFSQRKKHNPGITRPWPGLKHLFYHHLKSNHHSLDLFVIWGCPSTGYTKISLVPLSKHRAHKKNIKLRHAISGQRHIWIYMAYIILVVYLTTSQDAYPKISWDSFLTQSLLQIRSNLHKADHC